MNALTFFPTESVAEQVSSIFQSKKMEVEPERVCTQCGSTDTPLWRRGPHGPKSMCNRCGIRWKRKEDKKAGKKPNSNKKKKETTTTPKPKKIRTASDKEYLSSSLSPSHDSDSWLSELDDEDEMEFLNTKARVTMGSPRSEQTFETKEPQITVNLTPQGESFTIDDDATFARPEVPEPRRLSRDFINVNTSLNYRNDTEPMNLRKRKAKARSSDFDYEWNVPASPSRRKSRQELLQEVRNLPSSVKIFLEEAEAELQRIQKQENENSEITRLNHLVQRMASEMTELRQQNMQKDAIITSMKEQQMQSVQQVQPVSFLPGFRSFGGAMYSNPIPILPHQVQVQRVNLLC